jgi:predicted RNase H-like HicB family nuclease
LRAAAALDDMDREFGPVSVPVQTEIDGAWHAEMLTLTVTYEDAGDGWFIARIAEVPAAMSQGRTREQARENVTDALRELTLSWLEYQQCAEPPAAAVTVERLELQLFT